MKRKIIASIALCYVLGLQGCMSRYPAASSAADAQERISNIPTQPHTNEVEVLFGGEWPKEEYVKLAALEVRGGENTSYGTMIKWLQAQAQEHGADAIMVLDKNYKSDVTTDPRLGDLIAEVITGEETEREVRTRTQSELRGVAIKYKKNLIMQPLPKQQELYIYSTEKAVYEPALKLRFSYRGSVSSQEEISPKGAFYYEKFVKPYTLEHLVEEKGPDWRYKEENGVVTERQLLRYGSRVKTVTLKYNEQGKISELLIDTFGSTIPSERIDITYNSDGQVQERVVYREGAPYLQELYLYTVPGRLESIEFFLVHKEKQEPLLKSTYTYYSPDEIK